MRHTARSTAPNIAHEVVVRSIVWINTSLEALFMSNTSSRVGSLLPTRFEGMNLHNNFTTRRTLDPNFDILTHRARSANECVELNREIV